nr:hypothetical protein [Vibrio vulnificus]
MIKSLCGSFCIACLHPLTRRYVPNICTKITNFMRSNNVSVWSCGSPI